MRSANLEHYTPLKISNPGHLGGSGGGFGSGHGPRVSGIKPHVGLPPHQGVGKQVAASLTPSAPALVHTFSLSLSNK